MQRNQRKNKKNPLFTTEYCKKCAYLLYFLHLYWDQNLSLPTPKRLQTQPEPNSKVGLTSKLHQKLQWFQVVEMQRSWIKPRPRKASPFWVRPWLCFLFEYVERARKKLLRCTTLTAALVLSTRCLCKWCFLIKATQAKDSISCWVKRKSWRAISY